MRSRVHDSRAYLDRWIEQNGIERSALRRVYDGFELSTQEDRLPEHEMQEPGFYMPGLTAQPWWDSSRFPWVETMEKAFPAIKAEFEAVGGVRGRESVKHPSNLDDDGRWSAYYFFYVGRRYVDHAQACPETAKALASVPGAAECGMRVGGQVRDWAAGRVNMFDDSFSHEVWNESDSSRAVLLFDAWHPDLTPIETRTLAYLVSVWRKFIYMDVIAGTTREGRLAASL